MNINSESTTLSVSLTPNDLKNREIQYEEEYILYPTNFSFNLSI